MESKFQLTGGTESAVFKTTGDTMTGAVSLEFTDPNIGSIILTFSNDGIQMRRYGHTVWTK